MRYGKSGSAVLDSGITCIDYSFREWASFPNYFHSGRVNNQGGCLDMRYCQTITSCVHVVWTSEMRMDIEKWNYFSSPLIIHFSRQIYHHIGELDILLHTHWCDPLGQICVQPTSDLNGPGDQGKLRFRHLRSLRHLNPTRCSLHDIVAIRMSDDSWSMRATSLAFHTPSPYCDTSTFFWEGRRVVGRIQEGR